MVGVMASEFGLIDLLKQSLGQSRTDDGVVLGIGDDGAILSPTPGCQLVAVTDTLVEGVHFPADTDPADLGFKSVAVNLSDLAAMAARPRWLLISLTLPEGDPEWLERFARGASDLCRIHEVSVVGGDTCRGPLSVTVNALGELSDSTGLRRSGARPGDRVAVTGTLGDAALALVGLERRATVDPSLLQRLNRPTPRVASGLALGSLASACIDVSDGLLADAGHLARDSGVGMILEWERLPRSAAYLESGGGEWLEGASVLCGDDYELCFTFPADREAAVNQALASVAQPWSVIGTVIDGCDVTLVREGRPWLPEVQGYQHFHG